MPKPSPLPENLADCHALILEQQEVAARLQEKREQLEREIDALNAIDSKPPGERLRYQRPRHEMPTPSHDASLMPGE